MAAAGAAATSPPPVTERSPLLRLTRDGCCLAARCLRHERTLATIRAEPDYRTAHIGRHAGGQFFADVTGAYNVVFGLIDETTDDPHEGHGAPRAELYPQRLGFHEPWNGEYDT
ncbi:hypothetical protein ACQP00_29090 [Dactylosporangium sp. CS-047395]|uniref:hypothetical protein n=1 Tax=Dactylosporangium sp. CS-047395 TaxID=3239936 RepID=UPI003D8B3BF8